MVMVVMLRCAPQNVEAGGSQQQLRAITLD